MTELIAEPITMAEQISGPDVIQDLAARLVECLSRECHLQPSDAYSGYSAKVTAEIQLIDIDTQTVKKTLVIGDHDLEKPSRRIVVDVQDAAASEVRARNNFESSNLERDVAGNVPTPAEKKQKWYTPRGATPRAAS